MQVLGVLSWHYAAVVHTQTDYGTTGYEALGRRLPIHQRNLDFPPHSNLLFKTQSTEGESYSVS